MDKSSSKQEILYVVVIDSDKLFLESLQTLLSGKLRSSKNRFEVQQKFLRNAKELSQLIKDFQKEEKTIALVITELAIADADGLVLLENLKKSLPDTSRMILTGKADLTSAIQAINNDLVGQYILKPIENKDRFIAVTNSLLEDFFDRKESEKKNIADGINLKKLIRLNQKTSAFQAVSEQIAYFSREIKKLDLDEILNLIMKRIPPLFNAKAVSVFLFDRETNIYHLVRDNHIGEKAQFSFNPNNETPMQKAIEDTEIIIVPDINKSPYKFSGKKSLGRSCIIIPFQSIQDQASFPRLSIDQPQTRNICGILNLSRITQKEDPTIIYKATLIQNILGANVSNAQLYKVFRETHKLAITDGLTGLYNNRVFKEFLHLEFERARRYNRDLSMVMADIDFFKSINDTHGHLTGDEVLKELSKIFKKSIRRSDTIARYGGEEFAFILPQTSQKKAFCLIEKIRQAIDNTSFSSKRVRITVSFGIAQANFPGSESETSLIGNADKALYQAKTKGRNLVELAE